MCLEKQCFLISPIGEEGSDLRNLSDKVKDFLKFEVLNDLSYNCIRSDNIDKVGNITSEIISRIITSDLVIAFLDEDNANVYYELALRHATSKICISIVSREYLKKQKLPFDVYQERVFKFPVNDMNGYRYGTDLTADLVKFKNELVGVIEKYNNQKYRVNNPVTVATNRVILPQPITMEAVLKHIDNSFNSFSAYLQDWLPDDLRTAVDEMYKNGCATYITGEDSAFEKLTEMTRKAQKSIRTSRFAPQSISTSHKEFFDALCEFGKREGVVCKRIMCMNNPVKERDIWDTIYNTYGGSMKLFLTKHDNNFELVVIDNTSAFLHFYDENRIIKSTLYIRGEVVVKEFEKIYDRFLDASNDSSLVEIDCSKYKSPVDFSSDIANILLKFT